MKPSSTPYLHFAFSLSDPNPTSGQSTETDRSEEWIIHQAAGLRTESGCPNQEKNLWVITKPTFMTFEGRND